MNLIRKPLPEDLIKENGVKVAFFDNLRVEMNEETKIDEPVLDNNGNKIYDIYAMICPENDPHTKVVKLVEDSVKKAKGEKDFEGKTSIIDGYGESRLIPVSKFYKKAYDVYCAKKNEPQQLSETEIELSRLKAELAAIKSEKNSVIIEEDNQESSSKRQKKEKIEIVD